MQQGALAHDPAQADAESADGHAVGDALDCLVQVVAAGHEGCTVALQSGGILAAAQALQVSHLLLLPVACLLDLCCSTATLAEQDRNRIASTQDYAYMLHAPMAE